MRARKFGTEKMPPDAERGLTVGRGKEKGVFYTSNVRQEKGVDICHVVTYSSLK